MPSKPPGAPLGYVGYFFKTASSTDSPPPPSVCAAVQRLPIKAGEASRDNVITQFTTLKSCLCACMSPPLPLLNPLLGCWKWLPDSPRCCLPAEAPLKRVGRLLSSETPLHDDRD